MKWVVKNMLDEEGKVLRNKSRLVGKLYTQVEGIDFDETFAPAARSDIIRMFLAFEFYKKINIH